MHRTEALPCRCLEEVLPQASGTGSRITCFRGTQLSIYFARITPAALHHAVVHHHKTTSHIEAGLPGAGSCISASNRCSGSSSSFSRPTCTMRGSFPSSSADGPGASYEALLSRLEIGHSICEHPKLCEPYNGRFIQSRSAGGPRASYKAVLGKLAIGHSICEQQMPLSAI